MNNANKTKKTLQNIATSILFVGVIVAGGLLETQTEDYYNDNIKVVYYDNEYKLKDLYLLTNETEAHICKLLQIKNHHDYFSCSIDIHESFVDVNTNEEIALKNHEDENNYKVIKVINYFPFDEFKNDEFLVSEDEFYKTLNLKQDQKLVRTM